MGVFLFLFSVVLFLFSSFAEACDRCLHRSKAAYFSSASSLSCKHSISSHYPFFYFHVSFLISCYGFNFSRSLCLWLYGYWFLRRTHCRGSAFHIQRRRRLRSLLPGQMQEPYALQQQRNHGDGHRPQQEQPNRSCPQQQGL